MSTSGGVSGVGTITAGSGITVADSTGPDATVTALSATYLTGSLAADVAVTAATNTVVLTTADLAVGIWLLKYGLLVENAGATAGAIDCSSVGGTAVLSEQLGQQGAGGELPAVTGGAIQLTGQAVVGVSTAGTVTINVVSAVACTVKELTPQGDYGNASGYVAQRIA